MTPPSNHVNVPYERFLDCVHCGLCLNSCPTYVESGLEADSPRGRIHLMRAVADGKIDFDDGVKEHIDLCLGCLACETACPSGVHYREIIEAGRELSRQRSKPSARRWMMERTLYHPDRLERMVAPLRWAGKIGLEGALRKAASRLPAAIRPLLELLPELPPAGLRQQVPTLIPAVGAVKRKVGFITGCVMSVFFTPTNLATLHVLASNGCEIHIPPDQGCCGALAVHSGDTAGGRDMARHLIDHFQSLELDAIIINSAGCGSTLKDYVHLLADDPAYTARAAQFAALVKDVSELLAELPIQFPQDAKTAHQTEEPLAASDGPLRVAYHDACHLAHGQKVRKQPRSVLAAMPGIELVDLAESDFCCGSAGTYNLFQPEMAGRLLRRKTNHVVNTEVDVLVTGNPGCNLQIAHGLQNVGSTIRVMHLMDLLCTAYPNPVPGLPTGGWRPILPALHAGDKI